MLHTKAGESHDRRHISIVHHVVRRLGKKKTINVYLFVHFPVKSFSFTLAVESVMEA